MADRTQPPSGPSPQTPSVSPGASTATFDLPAGRFALAELFERVSDVRVELEPAVANPDDHALLMVRTTDHKRPVEAALRADPTIAAAECFRERADSWMYRITWKGRPRHLIQRLVAADITLLSARGRGGQWTLRLLVPEREGISRASNIMSDLGCRAEVQKISLLDDEHRDRSKLTDEQREALLMAFKRGYHEIPRDTTISDLADELGISHQAFSERFRRAYRHLVESEPATDAGGIEEDHCQNSV
jgi:predicted DNA binding protein